MYTLSLVSKEAPLLAEITKLLLYVGFVNDARLNSMTTDQLFPISVVSGGDRVKSYPEILAVTVIDAGYDVVIVGFV